MGAVLPSRRRAAPTTDRRRARIAGLAAVLAFSAAPAPLRLAPPAPATIAAGHDAKAVPPGLARAIHADLGPGPIGFGSAPLSAGVVPAKDGGFDVKASAGGIAATINNDATVRVTAPAAGATLRPASLAAGPRVIRLSVTKSTLARGLLVQDLGALSTSYQLTNEGLEQRFIISLPPAAGAQRFSIDLVSPDHWQVVQGGSAIVATGAGKGHISFGGLRTTDATGRLLSAHFSARAGGAWIVVDAQRATYPVTVDPTWTSTSAPAATLTNVSGPTGDALGYTVAMSADGTTALVGALGVNDGRGAAYVFRASSASSWSSSSPAATLTNASGPTGGRLGSSVALSADGTTALVGAPGVNSSRGAAYIFRASSTGAWSSTSVPMATLSNASGSTGGLGSSVALSADGTTALVGGSGAAYIFRASSAGSWSNTSAPAATLTNASGSTGSLNSLALSADGTTALVGAPTVNSSIGAAYIFRAASPSSWSGTSAPTATLTNGLSPSPPGEMSTAGYFGSSVALSADGTTALVGAPALTTTYGTGGQAYIFRASSAGTWSSTSTFTALLNPNGAKDDSLGASVALSSDGTTALVGAPSVDGSRGAAYIYQASPGGAWGSLPAITATLTNGAGSADNRLGNSVALSADGTTALVGAPGVVTSSGHAYIYRGTPAPGYWLVTTNGHVYGLGSAESLGNMTTSAATGPVVGIAGTPDGKGYWVATAKGAVGAFGDAKSYGDLLALGVHVAADIVAIAGTASGKGYYMVGADGGFFCFGNAQFRGSLPGLDIHIRNVAGMVASPTGAGYLLVGSDGGVFSFDTHFYGSLPGLGVRVSNIRAALLSSTARGYALVGSDGGAFIFGSGVNFHGSLPGENIRVSNIVGLALTPDDGGYWMAGSDGKVYGFGNARVQPTPVGLEPNLPVAAIAGA